MELRSLITSPKSNSNINIYDLFPETKTNRIHLSKEVKSDEIEILEKLVDRLKWNFGIV